MIIVVVDFKGQTQFAAVGKNKEEALEAMRELNNASYKKITYKPIKRLMREFDTADELERAYADFLTHYNLDVGEAQEYSVMTSWE